MSAAYFAILLFCGWTCLSTGAMVTNDDDIKSARCGQTYSSCLEAFEKLSCGGSSPPSGEYLIKFKVEDQIYVRKVYCDMKGTNCGGQGGWMQVSSLDMKTYPKCPDGLDQGKYGTKTLCGNRGTGCLSTYFDNLGLPYKEVCGFVEGYQDKTPDGFRGKNAKIDSTYLDGISITYGEKPRKHIWSFAAGVFSDGTGTSNCPCNTGNPDTVPTFVGGNWYCESGNPTKKVLFQFFGNDILWDGKKCAGKEGPCCANKNQPYFYRMLDEIVNSRLELRVCHDQPFSDEDVPIQSYEFLVR